MSGWYVWAGELSADADFFEPTHVVHVADVCPLAAVFLSLPPGWRFLTDGDDVDVWFDAALLTDEGVPQSESMSTHTRPIWSTAMPSMSAPTYRRACAEFLEAALLRPRMYFSSLDHLEATMGGHATGFGQLGLLADRESFNADFTAWLRRETGVSGAAGWARAIVALAERSDADPEALFSERVRAFLREWVGTAT